MFASGVVGLLVERGAAEFGRPDDEGSLEHPEAFEIGDESGDRAVDHFGELEVVLHVAMRVPVRAAVGAGIDQFDEANAPLGQTPGDEALPAEALGIASA